MGSRLLSMDSGRTGFSVFVDVALNGMTAMTVFLVIYMAVVRPRPVDPLEIVSDSLPRGRWLRPYEAAVIVKGGQPQYSFKIPDHQLQELHAVGLEFDTEIGRVFGTPRRELKAEMRSGRKLALTVSISDQAGNQVETAPPLLLLIAPGDVPFDPVEDRLRLAVDHLALPDAFVGRPYAAAVPILGGIEPYEVTVSRADAGLPAGLEFDRRTGSITGVPLEAAVPSNMTHKEFLVSVDIVDQQSAKNSEAKREPRVQGKLVLRVYRIEKLSVLGPFPSAGREGLEYRAAVVAQGGHGQRRWYAPAPEQKDDPTLTSLNALGLKIEESSGVVQGRLRRDLTSGNRPLRVTVPLRVDDDDPETPPMEHGIQIDILPPMQFLNPN